MIMKRLAIIGCGDLGEQIAYHALTDNHYQPVGFFDDSHTEGAFKYGLPIFGKLNKVVDQYNKGKFDVIMIALGYHHFSLKENIFNKLKSSNIPFGSIIHTSSYVDPSCKIGEGVIIYPGCTLGMNVVIKDNCLLNVGCVIAHDTTIDNHSFLSPGVKIAGFVKIGKKVSLGIGSVIIDNIKIADNVRTGAGAVVIENLRNAGLYIGIPAVFKKI